MLLGTIFSEQFANLGSSGYLIGLTVSLFYFAIGNSKYTKGQTVGKKIFGLTVLNQNGSFLNPTNAFLRAGTLVLPFFFNYLPETLELLDWVLFYLPTLWFIALLTGFILNKETRQTFHDLLLRTYVIAKDEAIGTNPINKSIYQNIGIILCTVLFIMIAFSNLIYPSGYEIPDEQLKITEKLYEQIESIENDIIVDTHIQFRINQQPDINTYTEVYYEIYINKDFKDAKIQLKELDKSIKSETNLSDMDLIINSISVYYKFGYDIGIWKKYTGKSFPLTMDINNINGG